MSDPASVPGRVLRAPTRARSRCPTKPSLRTFATTSSLTRAREVLELELACRSGASSRSCLLTCSTGASSAAYTMGSDDLLRVGVHRRELDRHREVAAVAVEDRAALRRERHRVHGLAQRREPVAVAAQHLELRDPERERAEHHARTSTLHTASRLPGCATTALRRAAADRSATRGDRGRAAPAQSRSGGTATRRAARCRRALTVRRRQLPCTGVGAGRAGRRSSRTVPTSGRAASGCRSRATMPSCCRRARDGVRRRERRDLVAQDARTRRCSADSCAVELVELERRLRREHVERDEQ